MKNAPNNKRTTNANGEKSWQEDLEKERKIIRIGNSVGLTLPEKISKYGIKVGDSVRIEAIDEKTFKLSIV